MIFTHDHDKELYDILNKNNDGIVFQALFNCTTLFTEERELSSFLNRKIQNGDIYKTDRFYYVSEKHKVASNKITDEIKNLIKSTPELSKLQTETPVTEVKVPKVVKSEYFKKTVVPPLESKASTPQVAEKRTVGGDMKKPSVTNGKPSGTFNRGSLVGKYAYIFYRYRLHDPLSNEDLRNLVEHEEISPSCHYQAFYFLKRNNFIRQVDTGKTPTFIWTGEYCYPFPSMKEGDVKYLRYKPEEYKDFLAKQLKAKISILECKTVTPEINTVTNVMDSTVEVKDRSQVLAYFDTQIQRLEAELAHVKQIRSLVLPVC